MSDEQTFPRARRLQLGYSALEDRVRLHLTLTGQQGAVVGWLPRRLVVGLAERLGEVLRRSHPATEDEPAADVVLALEHRAARSALAGPAEGEGGEAATAAEPEASDEPPAYLVSEARVEWREGRVLIGLLGHPMPTVYGVGEAVPVAGLTLTREQAHEALRMLADQAKQAEWALPRRLGWLRSGA
ncbi:MAG: hypothetical protein ACLFSI_05995 [Halorhodospira sp.]